MSKYLSKNHNICFSKPKEPHFFSLYLKQNPDADIVSDYINRFFCQCELGAKALGEGSVSYLYDPQAISKILEINPKAKFIVMVRNPTEMIYSYHSRLLAVLEENVNDFYTAWNLQDDRSKGINIPKSCHDPSLLQYAEVAKLGHHVDKLFQLAGRDRCFVIVHDDFVNDSLVVYKDVLKFIGVDYDGQTNFPRIEENKYIRFPWLQTLLKRSLIKRGDFLHTLAQQQNRNKGRKKTFAKRVRKWFIKKNRVIKVRPPLDPGMKAILIDTFASDIAKLSNLLDRDLSHWSNR